MQPRDGTARERRAEDPASTADAPVTCSYLLVLVLVLDVIEAVVIAHLARHPR